MVECEECRKKLGVFEGYHHPTLGRKHLLCSPCFEQVNESVSRWRDFLLANTFNVNISGNNSNVSLKKILPDINHTRDILEKVWVKPEKGM